MLKKYVLACDVGGTITKLGLFNLKYRLIKKSTFPTKRCKGKDNLIEQIASRLKKILKTEEISPKDIKGLGLGIPGLVNRKGVVYELTNIPGWEKVPLAKILKQRLDIPVFIDNDGNLTALGEWRLGKGKGVSTLICLSLGTGVGGGIIVDGKLFHGGKFSAAEIGHIPIGEKGESCNCGGEACLETFIGNRYLSLIAQREIKKGRKSPVLQKLCKGHLRNITPLILNQAAQKKDALSKEIWENAGKKIGLVLSGLVNVFNPELILIGGGVSLASEFILPAVRLTLKRHVMQSYQGSYKIMAAKFRKDAGLIGAAILAAEYKNVIRSKN